jgi:hypothetical protein
MICVRFFVRDEDYRPVKWPIKYPYWCTGYGEDREGEYATLVAYADNVEQLMELWPDAEAIDVFKEDVDKCVFSSRFPKPDWYKCEGD